MRRFLIASIFASGLGSASASPQARTAHPTHATHGKQERYPAVTLVGAHVGEALAYRPRDAKGRARHDASVSLERLLRCRQTGQRHHIDVRLADALYQVALHFAGHRVEIFSGFRPRAFCDRAHSRHMNGSAVDFHVEGVDNPTLIAYLKKAFHPAGIGFYPHGVHVHLDLDRDADTYWVDESPPPGDPLVDDALRVLPRLAASPQTEDALEVGAEVVAPHNSAPIEPPSDDPAVADDDDDVPTDTTP